MCAALKIPEEPKPDQLSHIDETNNPAFIKLYSEYAGALRCYFRKRRVSIDDLEDLVHEVYLRILRNEILESEIVGPPLVWSIAKSVLIDSCRKGRTRGKLLAACTVLANDDDHEPSPEEIAGSRESLREVLRSIECLSPVTRGIFVARQIDRMRYADIARQYGMTPGDVEKHVGRARRRLARLYGSLRNEARGAGQ